MWQQVTAGNPALVQTAFDILQGWSQLADFSAWLQNSFVYYFADPAYELVLGFRYKTTEAEWRIGTANVRGQLSQAAIQTGVQQTVDFMKMANIKSLYAITPNRSASDPIELAYQSIQAAGQANPAILAFGALDLGTTTRWSIILK